MRSTEEDKCVYENIHVSVMRIWQYTAKEVVHCKIKLDVKVI